MNGIFHPLKASDLLKASNRQLMANVAKIWDEQVAPEKDYMDRGSVILEEVGHWLNQSSWTDETGYYLKLRLAPLDAGRKDVQEKGRKVLQAFRALYPGAKASFVEGSLEDGEKVTLAIHTSTHSIGD